MSTESIRNDIKRLLASGVALENILVNDGYEEWGADCAVTRDQAEKLAGEWERDGQSTDALRELTPAVDWLKPCIMVITTHV